jgi:hypothetical protein
MVPPSLAPIMRAEGDNGVLAGSSQGKGGAWRPVGKVEETSDRPDRAKLTDAGGY